MCVMTKRRTNVVVLGQMHEHHTNLEPRAADKNAYLRRAFHLFVHSLFLLPLVSSTFAYKITVCADERTAAGYWFLAG